MCCFFYLAHSCTAKWSVKSQKNAAVPELPPGSNSATGLGKPCKTNTNNKHGTWCDTLLIFYLSLKSICFLLSLECDIVMSGSDVSLEGSINKTNTQMGLGFSHLIFHPPRNWGEDFTFTVGGCRCGWHHSTGGHHNSHNSSQYRCVVKTRTILTVCVRPVETVISVLGLGSGNFSIMVLVLSRW